MAEISNNRTFKVLDDREHVLLRPQMYIGGVNTKEREQWVLDTTTNRFKFAGVKVVPALLKCASELIDNSIDVAVDTNFKHATRIKVSVDKTSIEVIDDGIGIPCTAPDGTPAKNPEDTCACLAWTKLKAGTSFSDGKRSIGTNGVGSSCVNVFSKSFIGYSDDGKFKQKISCSKNMSVIKASPVSPSSGKAGVKVYCEPDLERFGITEIDATHIELIRQRLINLAICYPKISFSFNGSRINVNEKRFAQMFSDNAVIESTDNATICVFPNEYDEFRFYSCVNGVDTFRGGVHVDYVASELCGRIRDKLIKKFKQIRPGDVKNKICLAVMLTGFENAQYDSQTKESLSNAVSDIVKHFNGQIDFEAFAKKVLKNDAIIDPIIETFKIKEELKARQEIKRSKKVKIASDKYMSPIGDKKYLALCEGASAMSGISSCLGRKGIGYYAMRGMPLNAYDSTMQKIAANAELKDITNVLGLDISKSEGAKVIDYDHVMITTDADSDGAHITAMLLGWFKRFAENLFNEGKILKLYTPNVILEDRKGKIVQYFFNVQEFKTWEQKNPGTKYKISYMKGLGSWEKDQLIDLIDTYGLDTFVREFRLDNNGSVYIDDWLGADAEKRKKYLREFVFDINKV